MLTRPFTRMVTRSALALTAFTALCAPLHAQSTAGSGLPDTVSTIAGSGGSGWDQGAYAGDNGPATQARLNFPYGIAVDKNGNVYLADSISNRVRKIAPDGVITTIAGIGGLGYNAGSFSGDGGPAAQAALNRPVAVALDASGNLYVSDNLNKRIRKIDPQGVITTFAGGGANGGDSGIPATDAQIGNPTGIALDADGNLYFSEAKFIKMVDPAGKLHFFAGSGADFFDSSTGQVKKERGDGGPARSAILAGPDMIAVDADGNLYLTETLGYVRRIGKDGIIQTVAGTGNLNYKPNDPSTADNLLPDGLAVDSAGTVFISDGANHLIWKLSKDGQLGIVSGDLSNTSQFGNVKEGLTPDGTALDKAQYFNPHWLAIDAEGNLLVSDLNNQRIRKLFKVAAPGLLAGKPLAGAGTGPSAHSGDVNGDGKVNVEDAILVLRFAVGSATLTVEIQLVADITGDGVVDVTDAVRILRVAVGLS